MAHATSLEARSHVRWHRTTWALQVALFAFFAGRGAAEISLPIDALGGALGWPPRFMPEFVRAMGVIHVACAVMLVLPLGRRWRPIFIPPAAMLLGYWMILECLLLVTENRFRTALLALVIGIVTLVVSWARSTRVPYHLAARTRSRRRRAQPVSSFARSS